MANYVPFTQPQFPTRPMGAMTGIAQADADFMNRQGQLQSLESMFLGNQKSGAELERYQGETPSKLAEAEYNRQRATQRIPHLPEILMGEVGDARTKLAAGNIARDTQAGKIDVTNSDNATKMGANRLAQHSQFLNFVDQNSAMLDAAEAQGPMAAQMAWDKVRSSMPPAIASQLPTQYNPQTKQIFPMIRKQLMNSVPHLQALELEVQKGENAVRTANVHGQTSRDVAGINQEGQSTRAELSAEQKQLQQTLMQGLTKIMQTELTRDLTPREQTFKREAQQILYNMSASRAAGNAMGYGFMNPGVAPSFPTPAPVGAPKPPAQPPRVFKDEKEAKASGYTGPAVINGRQAIIE